MAETPKERRVREALEKQLADAKAAADKAVADAAEAKRQRAHQARLERLAKGHPPANYDETDD